MGPWLCSHGRSCTVHATGGIGRLQWGRGFAATEGPWPKQPNSTKKGFNGAVALQPRKGGRRLAGDGSVPASMGPWLCSHGRPITHCHEGTHFVLQWGRGFAATEGGLDVVVRVDRHQASMGPWLCSHGRMLGYWLFDPEEELQWGRGFAATEGHASRPTRENPMSFNGAVALQPRKEWYQSTPPPKSCWLQWGRGFAATEGWLRCGRLTRACGFNGAVALQPRKGLQGAVPPRPCRASMGPWLCSHGRRRKSPTPMHRTGCFNGAVALQPRKALPAVVVG